MKVGIYSSVPQSGKSTVSRVFQENGFHRVSFAEPVKNSLYVVLEALEIKDAEEYLWGDKKDKGIPGLGITGGMLMSKYATDFVRDTVHKDVWVNAAKKFIASVGSRKNWVCDDLRFENEFELFDCTIHVIRPGIKPKRRSKKSEGNLDKYNFSFTIVNDGTEDELRQKAKETLDEIVKMSKL